MGSGAVTLGYSEAMLRGQADKVMLPSNDSDTKITMGGFAKASIVNTTGKVGLGNENLSASLKGVGDVLTARAQAGLATQNGLGVTAGARASVFSGRVTVEFQISNTQIELGVMGDAISAGVEASFGVFEDGWYQASARASLGVGGGFVARIKPGWE